LLGLALLLLQAVLDWIVKERIHTFAVWADGNLITMGGRVKGLFGRAFPGNADLPIGKRGPWTEKGFSVQQLRFSAAFMRVSSL
jgi:hypothetical protein